MATSNLYSFDLDILEIIEEAYENAGYEIKAGYELQTARRSLDLLLTEWVNEGINLWTVEEIQIPVLPGVSTYQLDPRIVDVIQIVYRDPQGTDINLERYTMQEFQNIPNKTHQGRPTNYTTNRNRANVSLSVWPLLAPNQTGTLIVYAFRYIQNVGAYSNTLDISRRFLPALCAGLAYKLALKAPSPPSADLMQVMMAHRQELRMNYETILTNAKEEDRERAPLIISITRRRR